MQTSNEIMITRKFIVTFILIKRAWGDDIWWECTKGKQYEEKTGINQI